MSKKIFQDSLSKYLHMKLQNNSDKEEFEVRLRILKDIADYVNFDASLVNCTNASYLHPDHMKIIDTLWIQILQKNIQISQDLLNIYNRLKYDIFIMNDDILKFIEFLASNDYTLRYGHEKILKSNTLVYLLAVDGFYGYAFDDLVLYKENLKTKKINNNILDLHVKTVRQIYNMECFTKLSGNDSAALIFLSLLHVYEKYIKQSKLLVDCINDVDYYLLNVSKNYSEIIKAKANMVNIINFYKENVHDILTISNIKMSQLNLKYNKK